MTSNTTNIWSIKQRIQLTLTENETSKAAFREKGIILGLPDEARFDGLKYPVIFITNDRELIRSRPFANITNNSQNINENIVSFRLIIMQMAKDSQTVEQELDGLVKTVIDALRDNFDLQNPTTSSDPLVVESEVTRVDNFTIGQLEGKPLDGRIIKFMVKEIS